MRIFDDHANAALDYVYTQYLAKPYSDSPSRRGFFLDALGLYHEYPKGKIVALSGVIYRPNHGLAHNVRVASKIDDVLALYVDPSMNPNENAVRAFACFNSAEEKEKLKIVAAFYVACRESEEGFSPAYDSPYQRYRRASSDAFFSYAKLLKKSDGRDLFLQEELEFYKAILLQPYFNSENDLVLFNRDIESAKQAAARAILSSCHALDLARCFEPGRMNRKVEEVLAPLCVTEPAKEIKEKVAENFTRAEIQHIVTGNPYCSRFDSVSEMFHPIELIHGRVRLFQAANLDPEIAKRLVALSFYIKTTTEANQWAIFLNKYASQGSEKLLAFIGEIEANIAHNDKKVALLQREEENMSATQGGIIFKVVTRSWDLFARSLVDPSFRPGSEYYPELREGRRRAWTARLNLNLDVVGYEVVPTGKTKRHPAHPKKLDFTKHSSSTYCNPNVGYLPFFYKPNNTQLVGVCFDLSDCIINRIMMYSPSTRFRPYDFALKQEALEFLDNALSENPKWRWFTTLGALQKYGLNSNDNSPNEIMAGFRWGAKSAIVIFLDNPQGRLLAMLRAADFKIRLKSKDSEVPIVFYPTFNVYSEEEQKNDLMRFYCDQDFYPWACAIRCLRNENASPTDLTKAFYFGWQCVEEGVFDNVFNVCRSRGLNLSTLVSFPQILYFLKRNLISDGELASLASIASKNIDDFFEFWRCELTPLQRGIVIEKIELAYFIEGQLNSFLKLLDRDLTTVDHRKKIIEKMQLETIIKSHADFILTLNELDDIASSLLVEKIDLSKIIINCDQLCKVLKNTNYSIHQNLIQKINLKKIIAENKINAVERLINPLRPSPEICRVFFRKLKSERIITYDYNSNNLFNNFTKLCYETQGGSKERATEIFDRQYAGSEPSDKLILLRLKFRALQNPGDVSQKTIVALEQYSFKVQPFLNSPLVVSLLKQVSALNAANAHGFFSRGIKVSLEDLDKILMVIEQGVANKKHEQQIQTDIGNAVPAASSIFKSASTPSAAQKRVI